MSHSLSHPESRLRGLLLSLSMVVLLPACQQREASTAGGSRTPGGAEGLRESTHEELVSFYREWREFQHPEVVDGVPDYTPEAMERQRERLGEFQARLAAFDTTGWSVSEQIDVHLLRAEMNGLEFDHRVLKPWARNPAFYMMIFTEQSDVPAHEGPVVYGWIDTWKYAYPLSPDDAAELAGRFATIPPLLEQARGNLVGDGRDLWRGGIRSMEGQVRDLTAYAERVAGTSEALDRSLREAIAATERFLGWLREEAPKRNGPSGVGVEEYDWYLRNVHLVPFTWSELLTLHRRELARAHAALKLEEHRNRGLPPLTRIASADEYDRRLNQAVDDYVTFLREHEILTMREYMAPALRRRIGRFQPVRPESALRGFFSEVSYRDPLTMRTHGHHWFDLAMMEAEPHSSPIRANPLLYNIWDSRAEGMATGMEEWMMEAGLFSGSPRSRELIYILIAQRAARGIAGLRMHANEFSMDEAVRFAAQWTPRGWMPAESETVWGEQHLYLQQPYYGASYLGGKHQLEQLMAERSADLGEDFTFKGFMDEVEASGVIPVSLIRWELTGRDDEIRAMTGG